MRSPVIRPAEFESQTWLPAALKSNQEFLEGIFWPDGKIRVTGREYNGLLDTLCHTKGDLTCLSCHSIHQSRPNDQLAKGMDGNQACLQCHKEQRENLSAHTHHDPNSSGSLCYNCHMPYATYGLLKSIRNHYIDSPSAQTTHNVGRPNACNLCHLDQTLSWTAEHLTEWYRSAAVELNADERTVSASLHMLLKGNAAQRALMASALGWDAARAASGEHWLAYYLCQSLDDPYSAVRLIAYRSLATFPGFEGFKFDYISSPEERDRARKEAFERWGRRKPDRGSSAILMETNGTVRHDLIQKLLLERDNRSLDLIE